MAPFPPRVLDFYQTPQSYTHDGRAFLSTSKLLGTVTTFDAKVLTSTIFAHGLSMSLTCFAHFLEKCG